MDPDLRVYVLYVYVCMHVCTCIKKKDFPIRHFFRRFYTCEYAVAKGLLP